MTPLLLDGAMGTWLEHHDIPTPEPLWATGALLTHPSQVRSAHAAYAQAGCTVHTTNTFRAAPRHAGSLSLALVRHAVALARQAVPHHHRIFGSLAPVEDCWRPDLSPDPATARAAHTTFARLLAAAGVDGILVETFAHPGEALIATEAAAATGLEVWTSLTPGYRGDLLPPAALAEAAPHLRDAGASRVLTNCLPARHADPWVEALATTVSRWGIYANVGAPGDGLDASTLGGPEAYADLVVDWVSAGASVVGGCCGTTPAHLAAVTARLEPA